MIIKELQVGDFVFWKSTIYDTKQEIFRIEEILTDNVYRIIRIIDQYSVSYFARKSELVISL